MRELSNEGQFEFTLYIEDSTTYLLCSLGSNMYMFMSPPRQEVSLPSVVSSRKCWCCSDKTKSGVFCLSGLFVGEELVQKNPVYICIECLREIVSGWIDVKENAISEGVVAQI